MKGLLDIFELGPEPSGPAPSRTRWGQAAALLLPPFLAVLLLFPGCGPSRTTLSDNSIIITQTPRDTGTHDNAEDALDLLYPVGSRLVLVPQPDRPDRVILLSQGLRSAGGPVLGPDGREVLFVGKAEMNQPWQIFRVDVRGGPPAQVTALPGGAMSPAWLPAGRLVFSSPITRLAHAASNAPAVPALFSLAITGGPPTRLTYGLAPASDPTVLADGRILFVSSVPAADRSSPANTSLFTMNNDGTEITPYAGQHDGPSSIRRPRETHDGRVLFLASGAGSAGVEGRIEQVLTSRPFRSRSVAFPQIAAPCRSVEPMQDGSFLATLRETGADRVRTSFAVYRLVPGLTRLEAPLFDDPVSNEIEAVSATHPVRPMGRLSNIDPTRHDAILLCLDAHLSDRPASGLGSTNRGTQLRVVSYGSPGPAPSEPRILGVAPLHSDGSVLANVPSDQPLALELLDAEHNVLRRCPPAFWLRPGENRSCVGCHEPHNRAPENTRPLAVREPPVRLQPTSANPTPSTK